MNAPLNFTHTGTIVSVRGSVVDVRFDAHLPPTDIQWRSVHRAPAELARRSTRPEIFETGIKAIDVRVPRARGGKAGLFGGAGVGKTVLLTEMIHNMLGHREGVSILDGIGVR